MPELKINGKKTLSILSTEIAANAQRYELSNTRDAAVSSNVTINVTVNNLFYLEYEDGTTWIATAADLQRITGKPNLTPKNRSNTTVSDTINLPYELKPNAGTRGLGSIILKFFTVFTPQPVEQIAGDALHAIIEKLESNIMPNEGVFSLDKNFKLTKINQQIVASSKPYLLFIHGTLSSTVGSFAELYNVKDGDVWDDLQATYQNNIIALEHKTVSKSPLQNLWTLVQQLPNNTTLHVVSHSRGGIVGDLLCLFASGITTQEAQAFACSVAGDVKKEDETCIKNIINHFAQNKISVEKFVRVACPANGTTLLTNNTTDFLNAMGNVIKALVPASQPIIDVIHKIITTIFSYREKNNVLPGLYAMVPDSNFQKALNSNNFVVSSSLSVIAGDAEVSVSLKGLTTIITNLIFWHQNDWVVDTQSMRYGIHRSQNINYFFTQGSTVNHFSYFKNQPSRLALANALKALPNNAVDGFAFNTQLEDESATRGAAISLLLTNDVKPNPTNISGKRPIVILIPGILGSSLSEVNDGDADKIYLDIYNIGKGDLVNKLAIGKSNKIEATGLIGAFYKPFADYFNKQYDVDVYPYDWRLPIADSAEKLNKLIVSYQKFNQPFMLVAHSMGGLVVRHLAIKHSDLFTQISQHPQFKILFLGSPLKGSYLIPEVVTGLGKRIQQLAKIDLTHNVEEVQAVIKEYKGLLSLLPFDDKRDFTDANGVWKEMQTNATKYNWQIPSSGVLQGFTAFVADIKNFEKDKDIYSEKVFYVAGHSNSTVCDYEISSEATTENKLSFVTTNRGDGSVTWDSGIPQQLKDGNRVYYTSTSHGDLAKDEDNFEGILEIMKQGVTKKLSQKEPVSSSEEEINFSRGSTLFNQSQMDIVNAIMGSHPKSGNKTAKDEASCIELSVSCADLFYAKHPILVGHFKNDGIVSAEKFIDKYLNGKLSQKLSVNLYPGDIGTNEIFYKNDADISAVVVGLGSSRNLSNSALETTITQGLLNFLIARNNDGITEATGLGITSLLIGSSFAGLPMDTSVSAIINGVKNANKIYKKLNPIGIFLTEIELIEIYEDRALQALKYIAQEKENKRLSEILLKPETLTKKPGSRRRVVFEDSDDWWNTLSILKVQEDEFDKMRTILQNKNNDCALIQTLINNQPAFKKFLFSSSAGTAKTDVRQLIYDTKLNTELFESISKSQSWDAETAKLIFELLIPNDFKVSVRNQQNILLLLDNESAEIPWELLHDTKEGQYPIATQVGLIRQLATADATVNFNVRYATQNKAIVIADPQTDGFVPQLPYAKIEGETVIKLFEDYGIVPCRSVNDLPTDIMRKLFKDDYKIIHLAGHGDYNKTFIEESGMIIGNNSFLSPSKINQLPYVPELVFVNCCHIGQVNAVDSEKTFARHRLAATLGTQLIRMGVKCVIAAAWAVDDKAAAHFTNIFYSKMFNGSTFGDAVTSARKDTYDNYKQLNTWAAYQCYGNQFYTLQHKGNNKKDKYSFYDATDVHIAIDNILNRLDPPKKTAKDFEKEISKIEDAIEGKTFAKDIMVKYLLAKAYKELRCYDKAIKYFTEVVNSSKGIYPIDALEGLCFVMYKKYYTDMLVDKKSDININEVITKLENLIAVGKTAERYSLMAAAYKTKAMFLNKVKEQTKALENSVANYREAFKQASETGGNVMYPLTNAISIEMIINPSKEFTNELTKCYEAVKPTLNNSNFWDIIVDANYALCKMLIETTPELSEINDKNLIKLKQEIKRAWQQGGSENKKLSEIEHANFLIEIYRIFNKDTHVKLLQDFIYYLTDLKASNNGIF